MTKFDETKLDVFGLERPRAGHVTDMRGPNRPPIPKSKKERPASKGRVHKGKTRN